jgi:hypothetical protein
MMCVHAPDASVPRGGNKLPPATLWQMADAKYKRNRTGWGLRLHPALSSSANGAMTPPGCSNSARPASIYPVVVARACHIESIEPERHNENYMVSGEFVIVAATAPLYRTVLRSEF